MNQNNARRGIRHIAQQNGVSVEEVREELRQAIAAGMNDPDPNVQIQWRKVPRAGEVPTPEELIAYLAVAAKKAAVQ